jgi:hypothetical protein
MRSGAPSVTYLSESGRPGFASPGTFRSWALSALQRLTPPTASLLCFAQTPLMGFEDISTVTIDHRRLAPPLPSALDPFGPNAYFVASPEHSSTRTSRASSTRSLPLRLSSPPDPSSALALSDLASSASVVTAQPSPLDECFTLTLVTSPMGQAHARSHQRLRPERLRSSTQDQLNLRSSSPHQSSRFSPRAELIRWRPSIPQHVPPSTAFLSA